MRLALCSTLIFMKARAVVLAIAAVLLVAACTDEAGSVPKVEKDELIRQADAVCKTADAELTSTISAAQGSGSPTVDQVRDVLVTKILPRLDQELGDLKDLGEPKTSRKDWDELVKAVDAALTKLKLEAEADPAKALIDVKTLFADADAKAQAFGLKECGKR
jgi:hypothetical protein